MPRTVRLALTAQLVMLLVTLLANRGSASDRLYWIESGNGGLVRSANLDGTDVTTVLSGAGYLRGMAADPLSGKVYYSDNNGLIGVANLDGTNRQTLLETGTIVTSVALDTANDWMYWTRYDSDLIERAHLNGSGRETVLTLPFRAQPLSIVSTLATPSCTGPRPATVGRRRSAARTSTAAASRT